MKKILYCVYDIKTGAHGMPFVMESDESAKRSFLDSLAEVRMPTLLSKFPTDYELRRLGEYDTQTGELIPEPDCKPKFVANAATFGPKLSEQIQKNLSFQIDQIALAKAENKYSELAVKTFKGTFEKELKHMESRDKLIKAMEEDTNSGQCSE